MTQGYCTGSGGGPCCIDPIFGPTVAHGYWSASTYAAFPAYAWYVYFGDGFVNSIYKGYDFYVRAVRSGS